MSALVLLGMLLGYWATDDNARARYSVSESALVEREPHLGSIWLFVLNDLLYDYTRARYRKQRDRKEQRASDVRCDLHKHTREISPARLSALASSTHPRGLRAAL